MILQLGVCALVVGGVSACGDDGGQPHSSVKLEGGSGVRPKTSAGVRLSTQDVPYRKSVKVTGKNPQSFILEVTVRNAKREPRVRLVVPAGARTKARVSVGGPKGKPSSGVTLSSTKGRPFEVFRVRYQCSVLPPTICPVDERRLRTRFELDFVSPKDREPPLIFKLDTRPAAAAKR